MLAIFVRYFEAFSNEGTPKTNKRSQRKESVNNYAAIMVNICNQTKQKHVLKKFPWLPSSIVAWTTTGVCFRRCLGEKLLQNNQYLRLLCPWGMQQGLSQSMDLRYSRAPVTICPLKFGCCAKIVPHNKNFQVWLKKKKSSALKSYFLRYITFLGKESWDVGTNMCKK